VKAKSALSALASSSNDPSRITCSVVILLSANLVCDAETIATPPTVNNIAIQFIAPPKENRLPQAEAGGSSAEKMPDNIVSG
jgi:hypothetical protein